MLPTQGTDSGSDSTIQCDGGLCLLEVSFRDSALQPFTRILCPALDAISRLISHSAQLAIEPIEFNAT